MKRFILALAACLAVAVVATAEDQKEPDKPPAPTPIVTALPAKAAAPARSLKYVLLPDAGELTPGNAASLWRQSIVAIRDAKAHLDEKQYKWLGPGPEGTALKDLPKKEVREFLDKARGGLRLADLAARRSYCDWDYPPLTIQNVSEGTSLGEVQGFRELASLLSLRFRYQLGEGKVDDAVATLQTGFALGRHIGEAPLLIQNLVGLAITTIMLGRVEELMQQPDAPNMYWALTALPRPFLDVRKPVEYEMGTFLRSFPQLAEADRPGMSKEQADKLAADAFNSMARLCFPEAPEWQGKMAAAMVIPAYKAQARKDLVDRGRKKQDVEAMSDAQAVLVWFLDDYARERDDILKWFLLPPPQALAGLEEVEKKEEEARKNVQGNLVIQGGWALRLLMPAVLKVYEANLRTERHVATLRTAEAIRLYAAAHDGKLPQALKDVTEAPLPPDPRTGKGFDEFYKADGDKAALEVPLHPRVLIRRYEFAPAK